MKYRVYLSASETVRTEAESKEEAADIALEIVGRSCDWTIEAVEEIPE